MSIIFYWNIYFNFKKLVFHIKKKHSRHCRNCARSNLNILKFIVIYINWCVIKNFTLVLPSIENAKNVPFFLISSSHMEIILFLLEHEKNRNCQYACTWYYNKSFAQIFWRNYLITKGSMMVSRYICVFGTILLSFSNRDVCVLLNHTHK